MPNQQLYDKAKQIINQHCGIVSWDDLADTNSLWDYIEDDMTDVELKGAAYKAMSDRVAEDDGAQMHNIAIEELWEKK